jgi:hypothetical protein
VIVTFWGICMIMISEALAVQIEEYMRRCVKDCTEDIRQRQALDILDAFDAAKRGYPTGIKNS